MENKTSLVINGLTVPNTVATITPAVINTNMAALESFIDQLTKSYEIIQYSEDLEEQKKQMKEDRAGLNKLSQAVDAERIRIKKEASKEIIEFENSYKNLVEKISVPCKKIDENIKALEKKQRDDKLVEVNAIWDKESVLIENDEDRNYLYSRLFSEKFLNTTTSKKAIRETFASGVKNFIDGMSTLSTLESDFKDEGIKQFRQTLILSDAIGLINRLTQQQKEAEERIKAKLEAEKQAAIREAEERVRREEKAKAEEERRAAIAREQENARLSQVLSEATQMSLDFTTPASNHSKLKPVTSLKPADSKTKVFIKIQNGQIKEVFSNGDIDVVIFDADTIMDDQELIDFAQMVESRNCKKVC